MSRAYVLPHKRSRDYIKFIFFIVMKFKYLVDILLSITAALSFFFNDDLELILWLILPLLVISSLYTIYTVCKKPGEKSSFSDSLILGEKKVRRVMRREIRRAK